MKPGRGRFEHARDHHVDIGHGPDGDGAALMPRYDVVRVHGALPTNPTSTSAADCLPYKEEVAGSSPSSSTVAEVEVVDTPGRGPGGSRFESGRSPHLAGDLEISGGS